MSGDVDDRKGRGSARALALFACLVLGGRALVPEAIAQPPCGVAAPCEVEDGSYLVAVPPGWDGATPLPAVMFFHGWQATAARMLGNESLMDPLLAAGQLVILPDGRDRTWAHVGSPSQARDEIAFVREVAEDATARFPIDVDRFWVSGFSQGGSMAWDVACYLGAEFTAFAPIAGAFWEPLPETCPGGPVDLRHIHGTDDGVVPMAGRGIARIYRQGDVRTGMAILGATNQCSKAPTRIREAADGLTCEVWDRCASGRQLELCLHDGGHGMPAGWQAGTLAWLRGLPAWGSGGSR